jgi:hypothetical protein
MAEPGGFFVSIFGHQTIKESTQREGEYAAMQDYGAQDTFGFCCFLRYHLIAVDFVCLAGMSHGLFLRILS